MIFAFSQSFFSGNTLRVLFKIYCSSNRHSIDPGCNDSPDTMLSDQVKGFFHSFYMFPKESDGVLENADAVLFNLRNPIDRALSWYHYEHPHSCLHNTATRIACHTATHIEENPRNETALFFQSCFPSQHDFAAAFNRTSTSTLKRACTNLAHKVVQGRAVKPRSGGLFKPLQGFKHISFNMRYYVNRTLEKFPNKDVLVVRTESMWDDLKDLDLKLGGYGIFGEREGYKDSHGSENYKAKDTLSAEEYGVLCCAFQDEMEIYRQLLERAVNLDEVAKESTITSTAQRCGFPSWNDMIRQCTIQQGLVGTHSDSFDLTSPLLSLNDITFVRVGKTGRNASSVILKGICESMDNTTLFLEGCGEAPNSRLSEKTTGYVYGEEPLPSERAIKSAKAYLYNLGHPVDHIMSWYHYEHPRSCSEGHEGRLACETAREILEHAEGDAALFFQACFPTQDLLPLAFSPKSTSTLNKTCVKLVRKVVDGRVSGNGFKHISHNMRSYAKRTIDKYPKKKVLVVRTESLWDDLKDLDFQLGGSGAFVGMEGSLGSDQRNETLLADYGLLCCAMFDEMLTYRRLLEAAVNLDETAKISTITSAAEHCGFSSWVEMEETCTNTGNKI